MTGRARGGGNGRPITVTMQRPRDGSSGSPKKYRLKQYRTVIVSAPSAATDRLLARAKQQTNCPGLATIAAAIALLLAPHGTAVRAERSLWREMVGRGSAYPIGHTDTADRTPMRPHSRYFIGGLGMAIAMSSFVVALEISAAPIGPSGADPGQVNRGLKGDRLPLIPGASGARPMDDPRAHEPKLPEMCAAAFDARRGVFSAEVAGRCVASAPIHRHSVAG